MSQVYVGDAAELAQASAGGLLQPVPEARKWRTVRRFARNKLAVAGLIVSGPDEPKQLPRLLTPTTKKRSVSSGLPGPTMLSHQPTLSGSSA